MKISIYIFLGFLLILSMFTITTYFNFKLAEQVNENSEWFAKSTTIVRHGNRFQRNILTMVSGLRGYLFSGENYFIQAYDSAALENEEILKELSLLIPEGSVQKKSFNEILQLNNKWISEYAQPLIAGKTSSMESDSSLQAFNKLYRENLRSGMEMKINAQLQSKFRNFSNYEYSLRDIHKETLDASIGRTNTISFYLTSFSIITGVLIAAFLAYRISTRIVRMVDMANTIAAGNYEVYVKETGKDELGRLAHSLNHMSRVLSENISLLKRKNQELDQFAHIVSHDLKAPLRGIDNVITWIEEDHYHELSPKVKEYVQLIRGRLMRAENLIHGILSYSRIGREQLRKEEVDLNQLIHDIRENLALKNGIQLRVQSDLPVFRTERIPLSQVFTNLINNAIKYHDKPKGQIKIYYRDSSDHFEFFIEDNGPGIAKIYHDKIFGIFQTLNEHDNAENTGVGLAIVKKILDDRKQKISVLSEPGKGSTFVFTWPKFN